MDVSVALTNPEKGVSAEMHLGEAALEDLLRGHLYMDGLGKRLTVRLEYAAGAGCRMQKGFEDLGLIQLIFFSVEDRKVLPKDSWKVRAGR